jgi:hypothetical protein
VVQGYELKVYTVSHSTNPFLRWFLSEIGSCALFAWAGFEPWSYWSLPPEKLGLQAWATSTQHAPLSSSPSATQKKEKKKNPRLYSMDRSPRCLPANKLSASGTPRSHPIQPWSPPWSAVNVCPGNFGQCEVTSELSKPHILRGQSERSLDTPWSCIILFCLSFSKSLRFHSW